MDNQVSRPNFLYTKEEIQQEQAERYAVFYETMKTINPDLSDNIIKESFNRKFSL